MHINVTQAEVMRPTNSIIMLQVFCSVPAVRERTEWFSPIITTRPFHTHLFHATAKRSNSYARLTGSAFA